LPSTEKLLEEDPIVDVYRYMLYDTAEEGFYLFAIRVRFETEDRIERAKNEPVHNIPLSLVKPVQEIRRWRNLYGFVQEAAEAYQIPVDVIFATIAGQEYWHQTVKDALTDALEIIPELTEVLKNG